MRRALMRGALLLALAGALAGVYRSDRLLFEAPAEATARYFNKVGSALARHHGLYFLMTFDEARPVEWVGHAQVHYPGTERAPGHLGAARRFDGRMGTYIETSAFWPDLGPAYTLSVWVKLEDNHADQEIWYTSLMQRRTGLKLKNGRMTLFVPWPGTEQNISYPFTSFGRFVHIAATVDGPGGMARLHQDGKIMVEAPVRLGPQPEQNMEFGKMRWSIVTAPLCGLIDEASAWKRALPPDEIEALARARFSLLQTRAFTRLLKLRTAETAQKSIPAVLKMVDRINPFIHEGRLLAKNIPEINLHFSASDARHFLRAHEESLRDGRRTDRAANSRRIYAQFDGKTVEAQLCLAGSTADYPSARRPSFVLETPANDPVFGLNRLYLFPPESAPDIYPGRPGAIPADTNRFFRLMIDGQMKGIYVFDSFDAVLNRAGEGIRMAEGPGGHFDWPFLFTNTAPLAAGPLPGPARMPHDTLLSVRRMLGSDIQHPWSLREWSWRIRRQTDDPNQNSSPPRRFSALRMLGGNPSPYYVTNDLDLSVFGNSGAPADWRSSNPSIIDIHGKVNRPDGEVPVEVSLTASPHGSHPAEPQTMNFRVMPRNPNLPALMLYFNAPIRSLRRTDFVAQYYPAGTNAAPQRFQGVQGTGGGIKHRGLASYLSSTRIKKPFSLKFDTPHHILDPSETRHLYLIYTHRDPLHLKNKLVYDLFRSFASPGNPRYAPAIGQTEVFVNGDYLGIYDMCTRIRGPMLGADDDPADLSTSPLLFKVNGPSTLFANTRLDGIRQVLPDPGRRLRTQPLLDLLALTSQSDPETFAREIGKHLDLSNAVDFILLLNFTANDDGRTMNFYLARGAVENSPFFFIPWDYDTTFGGKNRWYSNHLFDRLLRDVPGFNERLARRWRELREGPLDSEALDRRILEMQNAVSGYSKWDFELLEIPADDPWENRVIRFRQLVQQHLAFMDERFHYPGTKQPD